MTTRNLLVLFRLILFAFLAVLFLVGEIIPSRSIPFNGPRAFLDVQVQVAYGPRTPGSIAHDQVVDYVISELLNVGWQIKLQELTWNGFLIRNIIAFRKNETMSPEILLGTHYDTRFYSDQDSGENISLPVPGANDGASGVAVLLELARTLPQDTVSVWLVFFDGEDNGKIKGRDWSMGSHAFVADLSLFPRSVVIVDMIGDTDLDVYYEVNSDPGISNEIWTLADELGFHEFLPQVGYSMIDDHTPFVEAGIPTALIIDFNYPYWHTVNDTIDKVSPDSLYIVGATLWTWIVSK